MTLRRLNIALLLITVVLIPLSHFYPVVEWWGWGLVLLSQLTILVYGCINIRSGYFMPVLCKADTNEKFVALSFDDGPHPTHTSKILSILRQQNAEAAFFCIGKNIKGNEDLLKQISEGNHIIGNHSFCHDFWFDMFSSKKMFADMKSMDETVMKVTGKKPLLFRPPYGVMNPNLRNAITRGKYTPIGWSVRSLDTAIKDKQKLLSRTTSKLKGGDIILLHDSMGITAELLPEIIQAIRSKGLEIVRLDKMLNIKAYA
jgi:peptidoglycan-N-acetylglucosamine deacetylase